MIPTFSQRLAEVSGYFANGDHHLGYRRLLDAAIETSNFTIYEHTLEFCNWYDEASNGAEKAQLTEKVNELLSKIGNGYTDRQVSHEARLSAENISKRYASGNFSLSSMTVKLHPSQIIGLVGENGNGKTTLLRILYGELKPDTGSISYRFTMPQASPYGKKSFIAFVPQRPSAWYGSLMENLQFASTYTGFKGRENHLWTEMIIARMGLRPYRDYTWGRISSGYKMRFELARTIITKPEVILLDEPLANLDMLAQQIILEDLKFLAQSRSMPLSIILSSQQLYEVEKVSDEVIFLQKGVARYQAIKQQEEDIPARLVLEMETPASRGQLQAALEAYGLEKISFNGGIYILYFGTGTSLSSIFGALGSSDLPVKYLRNISVSSRRFFDA
ncbi:MAG TPA: ABC transporter ATP-binding protein [Flavisolibacter sp.]|nr:ABC transporter ATP-binding protein [Flavisolibacter sp.]